MFRNCSLSTNIQKNKILEVAHDTDKVHKIMTFINLTPHAISLNSGETFQPSGAIARVSSSFSDFENGVCKQVFGDVEGLPEKQEGITLIVSALVLGALKGKRDDVVAPATGHPLCIRNEKGQIVSVPGFVQ